MSDSEDISMREAWRQQTGRSDADDIELTSFTSLMTAFHNDDHADSSKIATSLMSSFEPLRKPTAPELAGSTTQSTTCDAFEDATDLTRPKRRSVIKRMGMNTVLTLAATSVLTLGVFCFLTFLWVAPHTNRFWRLIVVRGWIGSVVTALSLVLRTAVNLQAGVAVAMLAAIFLETHFHLLLADTAHVSKLMAGRAVLSDVMFPFIRAFRHHWKRPLLGYIQACIVPFLLAVNILLQLASTILVSDLSLGLIPGTASEVAINFDFSYTQDGPTSLYEYPSQPRAATAWSRNPPAFPAFAEFSEEIDVPEQVDDTGRLFRAFLPFQDARSRESVVHYSGKAMVLDARVSCQRPQLQYISLRDGFVNGAFSNTENVTGLFRGAHGVPFNCSLPEITHSRNYSLSICEVSSWKSPGGILGSELRDAKLWEALSATPPNYFDTDPLSSAAYLVSNNSWSGSDVGDLVISGHGSWTDLSHLSSGPYDHFDVSISLCYPALWTARLNISIHALENRTEPAAIFSDGSHRTFPDLHVQMGEIKKSDGNMNSELRGILALSRKDTWLADPRDSVQSDPLVGYPLNSTVADDLRTMIGDHVMVTNQYVISAANMDQDPESSSSHNHSVSITGNYRMTHSELPIDYTIGSIFNTSLQASHGSAATALSTILTILSSMTYYDQFPNFQEVTNATTAYFETLLFPQSFRGFTVVLAATIVHHVLVSLIVAKFVTSTRLTTLGDHWQSISQVMSEATSSFMARSSSATDKEVRAFIKAEHRERDTGSIRVIGEEGEVGLIAKKGQ